MCGSTMVDIQSPTAEIRRGQKEIEEEEDRNHRAKINWPALLHGAAIKIPECKVTPYQRMCNIYCDTQNKQLSHHKDPTYKTMYYQSPKSPGPDPRWPYYGKHYK